MASQAAQSLQMDLNMLSMALWKRLPQAPVCLRDGNNCSQMKEKLDSIHYAS